MCGSLEKVSVVRLVRRTVCIMMSWESFVSHEKEEHWPPLAAALAFLRERGIEIKNPERFIVSPDPEVARKVDALFAKCAARIDGTDAPYTAQAVVDAERRSLSVGV